MLKCEPYALFLVWPHGWPSAYDAVPARQKGSYVSCGRDVVGCSRDAHFFQFKLAPLK